MSHDSHPTPAQADFSTHSQGIFIGWFAVGLAAFAFLFVALVLISASIQGFS